MKKKSAKEIFKEPTFSDIVNAQTAYDAAMHKLDLWKIGAIIALAGPIAVLIILNIMLDNVEISVPGMFVMFAIPAFISYALGGGIKYALSIFGKLAEWGWFLVPFFPIDLFVGLFFIILGFIMMIYLPIGFVLIARKDLVKERNAAEKYLKITLSAQV